MRKVFQRNPGFLSVPQLFILFDEVRAIIPLASRLPISPVTGLPESTLSEGTRTMMNRRQFGLSVAGTAAALTASPLVGPLGGKAFAADKLKVGFVYVGPVSDH